jgi:hypothetical protein
MTDKEKRDLHTETIVTHINTVRDLCYKMGIPELGNAHDLSKFSPDEFEIYKWADGKRSPHDNARDELGYSPSWYLHYQRNPHHWQHFLDIVDATPNEDGTFTIKCKAIKMPYDRVIEMFCDQWGASKTYSKDAFTLKAPLEYYKNKCEGQRAMYPASEALLKKLIKQLADSESEDDFINWYNINKETLQKKYEKDSLIY